MTRRSFAFLVLLTAALFGTAAPTETSDPNGVIVHEWGTFTSIAGPDGTAVQWAPQNGPTDVPCFVDRLRYVSKGWLPGTIRMETPVLYFYAPEDTTVNVDVRFRQGFVTEWFPKALVTPSIIDATAPRPGNVESRISWKAVKVSPRAAPDFPSENGSSHYYAARETDASPLQVGSAKEKFLFYRGVGFFAPPLTAVISDDGKVVVSNPAGEAVGDVILFENRGGRLAYRVVRAATRQITLDPPVQGGDVAMLRRDLERMLVARGLYPKEAQAMVETWRDSWFEEGTRLFYIASRNAVDVILPLEVSPTPTGVARVFVGRMELLAPDTLRDVKAAILGIDRSTIVKYGRFLQPIANRILAESTAAERRTLEQRLKSVYASFYSWVAPTATCK